MKTITSHKQQVKKTMEKSIILIEEGIEKNKEEAKVNSEKLSKRMTELTEKMEKSDAKAGESKLMMERLEKSMTEINVSVEKSQKQHAQTEKEVAALRRKLVKATEEMDQMENDMVGQANIE